MIRSQVQFDLLKRFVVELREDLSKLLAAGTSDPARVRAIRANIESIEQQLGEYTGPAPLPSPPRFDPTISFGKHRGKRVSEITDLSYLAWLCREPWVNAQVKRACRERLADSQGKMFDDDSQA